MDKLTRLQYSSFHYVSPCVRALNYGHSLWTFGGKRRSVVTVSPPINKGGKPSVFVRAPATSRTATKSEVVKTIAKILAICTVIIPLISLVMIAAHNRLVDVESYDKRPLLGSDQPNIEGDGGGIGHV